MQLFRLKRLVVATFPSPVVAVLKSGWQTCRRWLNWGYFSIFERGVQVIEVRHAAAGQLNQPLVADHLLGGLRGGFFLDIGANHPELNSNTHFFEKQRGYRGIALDPMEKYRSDWEQQRPLTRFLPYAAGAARGETRFFQQENVDGWADQLSYTDQSFQAGGGSPKGRTVQVVAIADIDGLPDDIAFASVDVEGAETEVLAGFRQTVRPRVLVVENCFGPVGNRELRAQIRAMGYTLVARISYVDDVFVRADLADKLPSLHALMKQQPDLFG